MCSCSFTGTCQCLLSISLEDFHILAQQSMPKVYVCAEEKLPFHKFSAVLWRVLQGCGKYWCWVLLCEEVNQKGDNLEYGSSVFLHKKNFNDGVPGVTINIIKCVQMLTFQTSLAVVLEKVSYSCSTEMLNSSPLEFSNRWGWDFAFHSKEGFWRKDW